MDRRTAIKWVMAVAATAPWWEQLAWGAQPGKVGARGYGTDPDLLKSYRAGELWPLTFTEQQRLTASVLCDLIIPADEHSPGAAQLEVPAFIDEWISAPYPDHAEDREQILAGLAWLDEESARRFDKPFAQMDTAQQSAICDDICWEQRAAPGFAAAAKFFARFRDLTADGFYTTPVGMKDLRYVGNVPAETFDGPPPAALKKAGLA